jgi:hypothetical protein
MKTLKDISAILLLALTVFSYMGHDIVDHYGQITHTVENSANDKTHRSMAQEPLIEDDPPVISSRVTFQSENFGSRKFASLVCIYPPELCFKIWLPPELTYLSF